MSAQAGSAQAITPRGIVTHNVALGTLRQRSAMFLLTCIRLCFRLAISLQDILNFFRINGNLDSCSFLLEQHCCP